MPATAKAKCSRTIPRADFRSSALGPPAGANSLAFPAFSGSRASRSLVLPGSVQRLCQGADSKTRPEAYGGPYSFGSSLQQLSCLPDGVSWAEVCNVRIPVDRYRSEECSVWCGRLSLPAFAGTGPAGMMAGSSGPGPLDDVLPLRKE